MSDLIDRQPSQKNDSNTLEALDCISRKAAIDTIDYWYGIDASEALNRLPSVQPDENMIHLQKEQAYMQGWEDGREALRENTQPEIIRCKDCIRWRLLVGVHVCRRYSDIRDENDFCSMAERKDDE